MAIERLNNNSDVLDMTAPPKDAASSSSKTPHAEETVIDMTPHNLKTQSNRIKVSTSGGTRNRVSIADLKGEEKVVHGNPSISKVQKEADDIIDLDNPNSMFNKYYNNKVKEYNERMQQEEDRVRDAVEDGQLDPNSEVAKSWLGDPEDETEKKANTVRTADIDFGDDEDEDDGAEELLEDLDDEDDDDLEDDDDDVEDDEDEPETVDKDNLIELEREEEKPRMAEEKEQVKKEPEKTEVVTPEEDDDIANIINEKEDVESEEDDDNYEDKNLNFDEDDDEEEDDDEDPAEAKKVMKTVVTTEPKKKNDIVELKAPESKTISSRLTDVDLSIRSKKSELKDDDEEEEENTQNPADDNEVVNKLRKMATEKLKPRTAAIDISNFVIGKASVKNINPVISIKEDKIAKWVLINQEQVVLMREFSGVELQTFVETSNTNNASAFSRRMRLIYNHIESPKPETFEKWLKCTPYSDLDHYYFGVYVASFNGANYMPIDCEGGTKCPEGTFVSDDVPIMDLVKFTDDKVKKKFKKIYKEETVLNNPEGKFVYNMVPLNSSIAVGFKEPMIYDFIETISVDDTFSRKYGPVINMIPYIDNFYVIDQNNGTLNPVGYSEFANNSAKTFRSRIRKYNTILSYLSPDEYTMIEAYANDIRDHDDGITYIIPSLTCPYCGTESKEAEMSAEALVFTRYQLGALVNTTLK